MRALGDPAAAAAPHVSVILPVHNAEPWLDECLRSVLQQDFQGSMELSVFNDASQDRSAAVIERWKGRLEDAGIPVVIGGHDAPAPRGVGYSKNQAIAQSSGSYLCFLDSDDVMMPQRVRLQLEAAAQHPTSAVPRRSPGRPQAAVQTEFPDFRDHTQSRIPSVLLTTGCTCSRKDRGFPSLIRYGSLLVPCWYASSRQIIGCRVRREPPNSTERYTRWINQLTPDQLLTQVFTSHGPTVIMPTWFCSRAWFFHVGPFDEGGQGVPEDLLFFYDHLRKGGGVVRVDQSLLLYRYLPDAATHSVLETTIWTHRVRFLEERVLPRWAAFTIWNAGRQGRRLYRSLTAEARRKVGRQPRPPHPRPAAPSPWPPPPRLPSEAGVLCAPQVVAFCDVDENKIRKGFYCHEDSQERPKPRVPILHFRAARPPFVICVKLDLTGGAFEDNLRSLHLREGQDFLHFS
ncbi:UDP-GlcNAc:betaGal beta-1,3-N-acetylglucosaminyltransferase-like protein 1 isoform X4 [Mustela erminea]|uniref:UDP-GlcNAc:betaGal beta-1,3-N-acetylglucosaminyltransferase-like protein 1 isoform X4 n=1 Tax=Mustela erminea TaxID=36723 RepID=UPI001387619A|nr:UDP-GlcNAc:betaGal beta-1,3-N-acetylglucosaminyltransferase-like protein 1 isoform X4 [Mustela erminea]